MNVPNLVKIVMTVAVVVLVGGCGSGGNGTPGTATITKGVSLSATNPGVKGIDFTLILPDGVTVATNSDGSVGSGVVTIPATSLNAAKASLKEAKYTPASASAKGTLKIVMILSNPSDSFVDDNNFFTIACTVGAGLTVPAAGDFGYGLTAYDADGAPVSGAAATLSL